MNKIKVVLDPTELSVILQILGKTDYKIGDFPIIVPLFEKLKNLLPKKVEEKLEVKE